MGQTPLRISKYFRERRSTEETSPWKRYACLYCLRSEVVGREHRRAACFLASAGVFAMRARGELRRAGGRVRGVVVGLHLVVPPLVPRATTSSGAGSFVPPGAVRVRPGPRVGAVFGRRAPTTASGSATVLPVRLVDSSANLDASGVALKEFSKAESSLRARTSEQT